jgi:hypothetical protein
MSEFYADWSVAGDVTEYVVRADRSDEPGCSATDDSRRARRRIPGSAIDANA